jgi:phenylalanyl-tRNA synthetase beta chain
MKFPESWLREHVTVDASSDELAARLTAIGLEVEESTPIGAQLDGVVVAHIVSCERHPDADSCRCARSTPAPAACRSSAARRTRARPEGAAGHGRREAARRHGHQGREAARRRVRRHAVLGEGTGHRRRCSGLLELPADAPVARRWRLPRLPDTSLELKLTPNRADCFSVRGIAFDVARRCGAQVNASRSRKTKLGIAGDSSRSCSTPAPIARATAAASSMAWTREAKSPGWLVRSCAAPACARSARWSDIGNFVMLELGQPMHCLRRRPPARARRRAPRARRASRSKLLDERNVELEPTSW